MRFHFASILLVFCVGLAPPAVVSGSLRESTYLGLSEVHELLAAERHGQALARLDTITVPAGRRYEYALIQQTYGYLYASMGRPAEAITALNASLAVDALPAEATKNALRLLVQLQLAVAEHAGAVVNVARWLALEKSPSPSEHALAGAVYARANHTAEAIAHLHRAIEAANEPEEAWFGQLLQLYIETARSNEAAQLLERMVLRFPARKEYWLQLAATYQVVGDDARALAVLELARRTGVPLQGQELLHLVGLLLYRQRPYEGATLLAAAIEDGVVPATVERWQSLSDAWLRAREFDRALDALDRALEIEPDASIHLRRAQIAAQVANWAAVVESIDGALAAAGSFARDDKGVAYLLKGIGHYYLGEPDEAVGAFERAAGFDRVRGQAAQWLRYIAGERERLALYRAEGGTGAARHDHRHSLRVESIR